MREDLRKQSQTGDEADGDKADNRNQQGVGRNDLSSHDTVYSIFHTSTDEADEFFFCQTEP